MILLRDISLAKPPPGTTPNFINPESLAPLALDLSVIIIVLTISFVLIRLYSNYNAARGLGWDDLFCVIATIFLFIYIAMDLSGIQCSDLILFHKQFLTKFRQFENGRVMIMMCPSVRSIR